nr:MAG TPA: hypothetical protein [Caudoviricetes sp.]
MNTIYNSYKILLPLFYFNISYKSDEPTSPQ